MSETITAQELFEHVVKAVVVQGVPSIDHDSRACKYRGPNGLKCAAGHAMTDAEFEEFGGMSRNSDAFYGDIPKRLAPHQDLLHELQTAHDSSSTAKEGTFVKMFLRRAGCVAESYHLTMPVLP